MLNHATVTYPLSEFAVDVRTGLAKPQKELLSKYLYDDVGSALFEVISVLPEYGLTRTALPKSPKGVRTTNPCSSCFSAARSVTLIAPQGWNFYATSGRSSGPGTPCCWARIY